MVNGMLFVPVWRVAGPIPQQHVSQVKAGAALVIGGQLFQCVRYPHIIPQAAQLVGFGLPLVEAARIWEEDNAPAT